MLMDTAAALRQIADEFERTSAKYPPLYHQQFLLDQTRVAASEEQWHLFAQSNTPAKDEQWQEWHGPYNEAAGRDWLGRFYGDPAGLSEFKQLATSLCLLIRKAFPELLEGLCTPESADEPIAEAPEAKRQPAGDDEPETFPEPDGFALCLALLHRHANFWPMPLLHSSEGIWNDGDPDVWHKSPVDEEGYPLHPFVETIEVNLFVAARAFLEFCLDPDSAFFVADGHFVEIPLSSQVGSAPREANTQADGDYRFEWDAVVSKWHLRFRYGDGPEEVEDGYADADVGFTLYALALQQPRRQIDCSTLNPWLPTKDVHSAISHEEYRATDEEGQSVQGAKPEPLASEDLKKNLAKRNLQLRADLNKARRDGNVPLEQEIKREMVNLASQYNKYFDKKGKPRRTSSASRRHGNRVRNGMNRCLEKLRGKDKKGGMPNLAKYLAQIIVREGACYTFLEPPYNWVIRLPNEAE